MDNQDHKKPASSLGDEGHGLHLCHRCGWPFPNPHPSARQRRSHKKVCGKIEGYKIIESEQDDHQLAILDDEHGSDGDLHTLSPEIEKTNPKANDCIGGVGEISSRSQDDVFSNAVMEFSESGISPSLDERFGSVKELNKNIEQKPVEGDLNQSPMQKVDESAGQSKCVLPGFINSEIQRDICEDNADGLGNSTTRQGLVKADQQLDINRNEINLGSLSLYSEYPKISDPAVSPVNINTEICNLSVPDTKTVADSAVAGATLIGDHSLFREIDEKNVASPKSIKESDSTKVLVPIGAVENAPSDEIGSVKAVGSLQEKAAADSSPSGLISIAPADQEVAGRDSLNGSENAAFKDLCEGEDFGETGDKKSDVEAQDSIFVDPILLVPECAWGSGLDRNISDVLDKKFPASSLEDPVSSLLPDHDIVTSKILKGIKTFAELEENNEDISTSEETVGHLSAKDSEPLNISEFNHKNSCKETSFSTDDVEPAHDGGGLPSGEKSENPSLGAVESSPANRQSPIEALPDNEETYASKDVSMSKSSGIALAANEPLPSSSNAQNLNSDKSIIIGQNACHDQSIPSQEIDDVKLTKEIDDVSAVDLSGSSLIRSDSLEGKCGSASENSEINLQNAKTKTVVGGSNKDLFEPPSFMTLVQSGGGVGHVVSALAIETVPNNEHRKPDSPQAGWFPSLTNVVNESEGRKKNEEIIAKVTNWSPGKQHAPLKNLLIEAKSPDMKQVPAAKNHGTPDAKGQKDEAVTVKQIGKEWNSPARHPVELKKQKKGRPYWVPFVCCSSVNRGH